MSLLLTSFDGRITLKGVLGIGGMGEVHRAWDAGLERPVAVKFVRSQDPQEADRLLLEARLQARVEHPNVVRVHDTGTLEGRPCILLQLVEGRTFADPRTEGDWRVEVTLAAQAARGLGAAHRMGLVHRDVKPANILVEDTEEGPQARLTDFGLARDEEGGLTRSGLLMGTVDFMAPEQVSGAAPVDFRADIYGLGATLYAVLAGRPPFRNPVGSTAKAPGTLDLHGATAAGDLHPGDLLRRVLEKDPLPLTTAVPGLPRDLATVVAKAMEKAPERRYATAEALADDLERVLKGQAILARPMGWLERGLRWSKRNPAAAKALGASLTVMLATGAFATWNSRRSTLAALEAAQMGGEAKALELRMRMAHLAPAHDIRPVKAELRLALARLQARKGAAEAPSAYAQGRIHLILEELEPARVSLERAWVLGFRGPDLEEAMATVYSQLYEQARQEAEGLKDPAYRTRRLAEADLRFHQPALRHFQGAGSDRVLQARLAMLEQHDEKARDLAQAARRADPERTEAGLIEAQAWMNLMVKAYDLQHFEESERCAREGLAITQALARVVRSDPAVHHLAGRFHAFLTSLAQRRGLPLRADAEAGFRDVEHALILDADSPRPWLNKALILANLSRAPKAPGDPSRLEYCLAGVEACRTAARLAPDSARPLARFAYALYDLGGAQEDVGQDPGPALREGRAVAIRLDAMEPWDPSGLRWAFACSEMEARILLDHGRDASEPLAMTQSLAEQMQGKPGVTAANLQENIKTLELLLALDAQARGKDPEAHFHRSYEASEALRRLEPDQTNPVFFTGWTAIRWMEGRILLGRPVEDVLDRALPVVVAAHERWPKEPQLRIHLAKILGFGVRASLDLPRGVDADRLRAARVALKGARAHITPTESADLEGWLALAASASPGPGRQAEAKAALAYFTSAVHRHPTDLGVIEGLVRAQCGLGRPSSALRVLESMEPALAKKPEVQCLKVRTLRALGRDAEADRLATETQVAHPVFAQHVALSLGTRLATTPAP
ncbi:serine/threonine-protein kinase [Geothrix edaphica]|uniref:Protein kinase domain-containing protein n=1 Tax=Geothrix edaphica TaxID=2927976 RepID=A0ABQ5Q166_9BACT|nr:serine/threonine-protein kinase [Geothrix edaphica]GLH68090.1 hypothetical protein GETHED_24540 [Geothrix edaphica]